VLCLSGDTTVCLFENDNDVDYHQLILQKRTEGEQGRMTIIEWMVDGELLPAMPLRERQLEFIGDSYTCGFGTEESLKTDPFKPSTESATLSYASVLARAFGADYVLIAHSGMGVCRNYNSKFAGYYMPERYLQTYDMVRGDSLRWQASHDEFKPALTVIMLGGNDFSVGVTPVYNTFEEQYLQLIRSIRTNYGEKHPILCCTKQGLYPLQEYVRRVLDSAQLENVYFAPCQTGLYPMDEAHLGACQHPSYLAHQKMAWTLLPYVASITGWELPDNCVE